MIFSCLTLPKKTHKKWTCVYFQSARCGLCECHDRCRCHRPGPQVTGHGNITSKQWFNRLAIFFFFLLVFSVLVPLVASPAHRQPLRALCRRRRCELHQHSLHETEVRSPSPQLRSTRRYSAFCVPPPSNRELKYGIPVTDENGNRLGESVNAAQQAIMQVVVSRIGMAVPAMGKGCSCENQKYGDISLQTAPLGGSVYLKIVKVS